MHDDYIQALISKMAPTSRIYLTRHAEAEHNATGDSSIADALLTPLGEKQAQRLGLVTPELQSTVELIISSPLRRTLQTTEAGYKGAIERLNGHANVLCLPQLQECNDVPCDTGSHRSVLEAQEAFAKFNLEHLTPDWTRKQGFYAADSAALEKRAQWVRQFLRERPEQHIAVVAHGDFLRRLTDEPTSYWPMLKCASLSLRLTRLRRMRVLSCLWIMSRKAIGKALLLRQAVPKRPIFHRWKSACDRSKHR